MNSHVSKTTSYTMLLAIIYGQEFGSHQMSTVHNGHGGRLILNHAQCVKYINL